MNGDGAVCVFAAVIVLVGIIIGTMCIVADIGANRMEAYRAKYQSCEVPIELAYRRCVLSNGPACKEVKSVLRDICHEHIDNGGAVPEIIYED